MRRHEAAERPDVVQDEDDVQVAVPRERRGAEIIRSSPNVAAFTMHRVPREYLSMLQLRVATANPARRSARRGFLLRLIVSVSPSFASPRPFPSLVPAVRLLCLRLFLLFRA